MIALTWGVIVGAIEMTTVGIRYRVVPVLEFEVNPSINVWVSSVLECEVSPDSAQVHKRYHTNTNPVEGKQ